MRHVHKQYFWTVMLVLVIGSAFGIYTPTQAANALQIGADIGVVQPLTGVNVGPLAAGEEAGNAALGPHYRSRGIRLVRTHDFYGPLDMATLYPDLTKAPADESAYQFKRAVGSRGQSSDEVFASIVNGGFEPYFRLGDSYNNVRVPNSAERANWITAAVNVLRHYREGQWDGFHSDFRYVEIWNEPDNQIFWPRPNTRAQFFELYIDTANALRAAFPALKLGGPGLTPAGCKTEAGQAWTNEFLAAVKAAGAPLDFFSWHLYSNDPADFTTCARFYRQALDRYGFTAAESHLTEWNTEAESAAGADKGPLRTGARGAAMLSAGWMALQQAGVAQSLFYRGTDPSMSLPTFYGMFYADGSPKKVADAATLWRLVTGYPRLHAVTGASAGLAALAAGTDNGARALLLANTGAGTQNLQTWTASLSGANLADYLVSTLTVSDAAAGIRPGNEGSIPAEAVQLVLLTPKNQTFSASVTRTGGDEAATFTAWLQPQASDVGQSQQVFVAARAGEVLYCLNDGVWGSCGPATLAYSGPLPARLELPLFRAVDVRGFAGAELFVGYGSNLDDMLQRQRYQQVHRF